MSRILLMRRTIGLSCVSQKSTSSFVPSTMPSAHFFRDSPRVSTKYVEYVDALEVNMLDIE